MDASTEAKYKAGVFSVQHQVAPCQQDLSRCRDGDWRSAHFQYEAKSSDVSAAGLRDQHWQPGMLLTLSANVDDLFLDLKIGDRAAVSADVLDQGEA